MSEATRDKVCYVELFEKFRLAADAWLKAVPEVRGLYLVVDWNVGKTDFPAAHMVTRDEPTEVAVLESMSQTLKLLGSLSNLHRQQLESATSTIRQAEKLIKQSQNKSQDPLAETAS